MQTELIFKFSKQENLNLIFKNCTFLTQVEESIYSDKILCALVNQVTLSIASNLFQDRFSYMEGLGGSVWWNWVTYGGVRLLYSVESGCFIWWG